MKRETADQKRARETFNEIVLAKGRCVMCRPGEVYCVGPCDPHHVIKAQTIRGHARYSLGLKDEELWAVVYDPRIGVPLGRRHHHRVTIAAQRMKPWHLNPEIYEFTEAAGLEVALEHELNGKAMVPRGRGA